MAISKAILGGLLGVMTVLGTGCHELQRHRLDRWNHVPDSMPSNGYNFSIPDPPLAEPDAASQPAPATCTPNACAE